MTHDNLQHVWQNQKVEVVEMSVQELRSKAERFQRRIGRRNLREYIGAVAAIGLFGYALFRFDDLGVRVGVALMIAGALTVVYQMRRRASSRAVPEDLAWESCLNFHRRELERQRDYYRHIWRWGILPIVPGLVVFLTAASFHDPADWPAFMITAVVGLLLLAGVGKWNTRAGEKLQRRITELEALEQEA